MAASFAAVFPFTPAFLQHIGGEGDSVSERHDPELTGVKPEQLVCPARQRVSEQRIEGEGGSVSERRNKKLISIKPELRVCPAKQRDSVPEEEKDSKEVVQRFLDSRVGLQQLTQMID